MKILIKPILVVLIISIFISCNTDVIFEKNKSITDGTWRSKDFKKFDVNIEDTTGIYDFYLNIRNSTDYKFTNLYLFIRTSFPDGTIACDTVDCPLAHQDGKWIGNGFGKFKDNRILLKNYIRFPKTGVYSFEIEQAMREENLTGIKDIGIRISKTQGIINRNQ